MTVSESTIDAFLMRAPATLTALDRDVVAGRLKAILQACRERWPGLDVPDELFASYLADRAKDREDGLTDLRAPDLYLACACGLGADGAVEAFDGEYLPQLAKALARMDGASDLHAEIAQRLKTKLFVPGDDRPPRIFEFNGHSTLWRWVRVIAVRDALDLLTKQQRRRELNAELEPEVAGDFELDRIRDMYRDKFQDAFRQAIGELDRRDRRLLRMHFLDGVGLAELARVEGVHRATVVRWIRAAREAIAKATVTKLGAELGNRSDAESIIRLVRSQLDVSLGKMLATRAESS